MCLDHIFCTAAGAVGALIAVKLASKRSKRRPAASSKEDIEQRSTTSSAAGGVQAYETKKAVDEYLQFHFGYDDDILPYRMGPKNALHFPARCALLCEQHCPALQDFTGEGPEPKALDLGCAVGGAAFELARSFTHVLGIDYSRAFVDAAKELQLSGSMQYRAQVEGEVHQTYTAKVPEDIPRGRVRFMQGDACALPSDLVQFDAVLAANLLCRLPDPSKFLQRAHSLVKPGGVLVLVSPYSWLEAWTPKANWVGAKVDKDGKPQRSADVLRALLSPHFDLVHEEDVPFLIREHVRKYQWGCSHGTVWRRRQKAAPASS